MNSEMNPEVTSQHDIAHPVVRTLVSWQKSVFATKNMIVIAALAGATGLAGYWVANKIAVTAAEKQRAACLSEKKSIAENGMVDKTRIEISGGAQNEYSIGVKIPYTQACRGEYDAYQKIKQSSIFNPE